MNLDDEVCCCFHVSLRKLLHFVRRRRPGSAAQMSECLGAGTGCGSCIPLLTRIAESGGDPSRLELTDLDDDVARREAARRWQAAQRQDRRT